MKNATKLVWLVMLFASSIMFAFGQTGANKMTTEQKVAYDNSVVVEKGNSIDLGVPNAPAIKGGKFTAIDETFDSNIPATWTQVQYSGAGIWQHVPTQIPGFASYDPPNTDGNYACANSDFNGSWVFDVGLFTPSIDMSGASGPNVQLDFDRNFQDFAGDGLGEVRVYSGGTTPADLEEVLWSQGFDDPSGGVSSTYMIDPTGYADPGDVYIEFYYSTEGGTFAWGFALDNVLVEVPLPPGDVIGYVYNGGGLTIAGVTVGIEGTGIMYTTAGDGFYELVGAPGGPQNIYAIRTGYNPYLAAINVPSGGLLVHDITMTAPTMIVSPTFHEETLNPEEYYTTQTGVLNNGDGPLHWMAGITYLSDGKGASVNIPAFTGQIVKGQAPDSYLEAPEMAPNGETPDPYIPEGLSKLSQLGYIGAPSDDNLYTMDMTTFSTNLVGGTVADPASGDFPNDDDQTMYVAGAWGAQFYHVDATTGTGTLIGGFSGAPFDVSGVATDPTSGDVYVCGTDISASYIGMLDPATGAVTQIGSNITNAPGLIDIAIDASGQMYGWCLVNDESYLIDKSTGVATTLGALGFDANFGQGGNYDANNDIIWMTAYNNAAGAELRILDPVTGSSAFVGGLPASQCAAFGVPRESAGVSGTWLTLDYYENDVPPFGGLDNVPTNFNAAGMVAGEVHTAEITFTSDPDVGTITIPVTLIVSGDPLTPPTDLTAQLINDVTGTVQLDWNYVSDVTLLFFLVKRDGTPSGTAPAGTTTYQEDLPDYGSYCYTVQAAYDEGNSAPTEEACVDWDNPIIMISPDFHAASIWTDASYIWETTVSNDGVGGLAWSVPAPAVDFVTDVTPAAGLLPGGASEDVLISWSSAGYSPGTYTTDVVFESNDPSTPTYNVTNEMTVYEPGEFIGTVTDCESGLPIQGVTVTAGPWQALTDIDGEYSLFVDEGTYDVSFDKLAYTSYVEFGVFVAEGGQVTVDAELCQAPYPVPWVEATVNYPDEDFCDVEWSLPEGPYEIAYDDGVAEDLFAWATGGNENAVLFEPAGYPAQVFGGRVFVGDGTFPVANWLGTEFVMMVYDDDGTDGLPGTMLDSIPVTVNNYGWVEFTGLDVTFEEGNFYLSMLQVNFAPNTAPIGIDNTFPQAFRSYSRSSVAGVWSISPYQDFMMRAYINGPQTDGLTDGSELVRPPKIDRERASKHFITANNTPFTTRPGVAAAGEINNIEGFDYASEDVLYYTVVRVSDFDPDIPIGPGNGTFTTLNNVTGLTYQDLDFATLTMGWYAYGVQVAYSSGLLSEWTYSNIVGRDMDAAITFEITLCDGNTPEDVEISMLGQDFPYELFEGVTDETGIFTFPQVWKGKYTVTLAKVGYETYEWDVQVTGDDTYVIQMSEKRYAPRNLWVDPLTSYAYWDPPLITALQEDFEDPMFPPEGWQASSLSVGWYRTDDGSGPNWPIPAWDSFYAVANDDAAGSTANGSVDYLITPPLDLRETDTYHMYFDSFYDQLYGLQIATIEYSYDAGANWDVIGALSPSPSWEMWDVDLTGFGGPSSEPVWFAFHADDGGDWASGWAVDNVDIANGVVDPLPPQYHVYLDGVLDGITDTTWYQYAYLTYGVTYTASVAAEYSCGLSDEIYYTFTSEFLLPPRNLDGLTFDNTVNLWWEVPLTPVTKAVESNYDPNFVGVTEEAEVVITEGYKGGFKALGESKAELWNNGPLVNSPGTGAGGADESVLQAGLGTYGFGCQWPLGYMIADNFEVVGPTWDVDQITVYGYQTNSGPPSSFTGCYLQIFDGDPSAGGTVIWGDMVTNVLTTTDWTGIYRVNAVNGGTARPIMYLTCETPALSLPAGEYWLTYSLDGSGSSGPWTPPVTIDGVLETGDALQYTDSWGPALDGTYQQDFPFIIEGSAGGGGGGGEIPDNLLGYNVYRDMTNIDYVPYIGEDTTYYFDYDLEPLCYQYDVTAVYDLTPYGFPGEEGESAYEGPFDICVEYGWPLEFVEDWNTGSFDPNLWSHGDNWRVNGQFGNPLPCAEFTWDPVLTNYRSALTSYPIDGKYHPGTDDEYIDGRIWFDFEVSLEDNGMSGEEMLYVQVWDEGDWNTIATYDNADGSFDWTMEHIEITDYAFGKIFKVRFAAEGVSSDGILSWFVDNIHIYRQCDAPLNLTAEGIDPFTIELNWSPPEGGGGGGGTTGEWVSWDDGVNFTSVGLGGGTAPYTFDVASRWEPAQIAAYEDMYITKIRFFAGATGVTATFKLKVWEGADAGTLLYEEDVASVLIGDWNEVELATPVAIDVTKELWFGYETTHGEGEFPAGADAGPAVAGYGDMISQDGGATWDALSLISTLNYNWNLQAYIAEVEDGVVGAPQPIVNNTTVSNPGAQIMDSGIGTGASVNNETSSRELTGYNIYYNDDGAGYIFAAFTEDTMFTHIVDPAFEVGSQQCYYVTAVYADCEPESNEACVIVTGIEDPALVDGIAVYPNPARNILNITSTSDITHVTVMNYVGQVVYNQRVVEDNNLELNVSNYETGVYMVKVETTAGILVKKITIAH